LQATILLIAAHSAVAQKQLWIRQFGTSGREEIWASAPDGTGGVYVSGTAYGGLGGVPVGRTDPWLARYDSVGNQLWIRQFGTTSNEGSFAAAPDALGGVYVGGWTLGSLGGSNAGKKDAWLGRYDGAGNQLWAQQLGTSVDDAVLAAASDASNGVYLGGMTLGSLAGVQAGGTDAWLARYDGAGIQLWLRQLGTGVEDEARAAAPDSSGGLYVAGQTAGSLGGPNAGSGDIWLARYDGAGNQSWIRQFGSSSGEYAYAAAPDGAGGVYVGGFTWGDLGAVNAGYGDAWVARYDGAGNQRWIRQLGTGWSDFAYACAAGAGGVFLSGLTYGSFGGTSGVYADAWLARFDDAGKLVWIQQLGTLQFAESAFASAPDAAGGVYVSGYTFGSLGGPNAGDTDPWLARYLPCEIGRNYCASKMNSAGCLPVIQASGYPSANLGSGFTISTIKLLDNKFGLYFYSKSGPNNVPFQGGTLCAQLPLVRTALQNSGGTPPCGAAFQLDFNAYVASGKDPGLVAGQQVWIQTWSRDPGFAPPNNTSLSDALTFTLCP
jgi:hypothetical protein